MSRSPEPFGPLLRSLRLAKGLTQEELAERAGLSVNGISALERGIRQTPMTSTLRLLADGLDLRGEEREAFLVAGKSAGRSTHDLPPAALPPEASEFVGRNREIHQIVTLLRRDGVRLLTLRGEGGVGKTRLALRAGRLLRDEYEDAVYFVPLADLSDPALLAAAIARPFGIADAGAEPLLDVLGRRLAPHRLLLILDNMEQMVAASTIVVDLLQRIPDLTVLVTSRIPLRLSSEQEYWVPPLELPPSDGAVAPDELENFDAMRLFSRRARAMDSSFQLGSGDAGVVAEICAYVDGLPLGIELAAARTAHLTPRAILDRMKADASGGRLNLLRGGARDAPDRQRTLRHTIDWSHQLLSPEARRCFARLSVFSGGCTLEAIEAVCRNGAGGSLDAVAELVDASLMRREAGPDEQSRYTMLETIREFAGERLKASGEWPGIRRRHAEYFLSFARTAEAQLNGPAQALWADLLEVEHSNLRAALRWAIDSGEVELSYSLGARLWRFWWLHAHMREGRSWLRQILEAGAGEAPPAPPELEARVLSGAGALASMQGDYPEARARMTQALALWRQVGNEHRALRALNTLGVVSLEEGDFDGAAAIYQEVLDLARRLDDLTGVAVAQTNLGMVALARQDYAAARDLFARGLATRRELGDLEGISVGLLNTGEAALLCGDLPTAASLMREGLRLGLQLGNKRITAAYLEGLAAVLGRMELPHAATRLLAAGDALRESVGTPLAPSERLTYDLHLEVIRRQLTAREFEHAWNEGLSFDFEALAALVRSGDHEPDAEGSLTAIDRTLLALIRDDMGDNPSLVLAEG